MVGVVVVGVAVVGVAVVVKSAPNVPLFRPGKQSYLSQNQHDQLYAPSTRAREIGERTRSV